MASLGALPVLAFVMYGACAFIPHVDYRPHEEITLCRKASWVVCPPSSSLRRNLDRG
jgi:hypothetical protein